MEEQPCATISDDGHTLTLTPPALKELGDNIVYTVIVTNESDYLTAELGELSLTVDDNHFEVTTTDYVSGKELAPNATLTFKITVSLKTVPTSAEGATGNITGSITATAK